MNKKYLLMILLIISVIFCSSTVSAVDDIQYYVDSGVDESGDGSLNNPFKTIEEAVNNVDESKTTEIYVNGSETYTLKDTLTLNYNHNKTSLFFIGLNNPTIDTSIALFKVTNANSNIIFSNLTFTSSSNTNQILSQSGGNNVTFNNCIFEDIKLSNSNGLLRGENSYLTINNSQFINSKNNNPVIVLKNNQNVDVINSQFNSVGYAVYSDIRTASRTGYINIVNSSFSNCYRPVRLTSNILNLSYSNFTNCGGAVILHEVTSDAFKRNTAIYIDNSKFISNTYDGGNEPYDGEHADNYDGGVIYSQANMLNVSNSIFKDNLMKQGFAMTMNLRGCAIYASNLNCINSTFDNNRITGGGSQGFQSNGGAIYTTGNTNISNSSFTNNYVNLNAGAVYAESQLNLHNCIFSNNKRGSVNSSIVFCGESNITDNIFLDSGNDVVINKSEVYNLDYNWWNTNERPNILVNNWIILDVVCESTNFVVGSDAIFTILFKNIKDTSGNVYEYNNTLSDRLLKAVFNQGIISQSNASAYEINSTNATFIYTPEGNIGDMITLSVYSDDNLICVYNYHIIAPYLTIKAENIHVGENVVIYVNIFSSNVTGEVTLKINNKTYTNKTNEGIAIFNVDDLTNGTHTVLAQFGDIENTTNITVNKVNTTLTIQTDDNIVPGSDVEVQIILNPDATGIVEIKVSNITDVVPVNYGIAKYTIKSISAIDYQINATYSGDEKYNSAKNSTFIHVVKYPVSLNVSADNVYLGSNITVNIKFNESDVDGTAVIKLDDVEKGNAEISNGIASFNLSDVNAGNHTISVIYNAGNKYENVESNTTVTVYRQNSTLEVFISQNDDKTVNLIAEVNGEGNVTFSVGSIEKTVEIINNRAILNNINLNNANYLAEIAYNGDSNYYSSSREINFELRNDNLIVKYYVDGIVSKSGDGSRSNPFKTINEASDKITDNYTIEIYISPDEYSINPKLTLNLNHSLKNTSLSFIGWGGDSPIINTELEYGAVNTFRIGGNTNVIFNNIRFSQPGDRTFNVENANLTFIDCIFENAKTSTFKSTIYLSGGNLKLESVTVNDCNYAGTNGGFIHIAARSSNVQINNSKFSFNEGGDASVIFTQGTGDGVLINVTINNSIFKGNKNVLRLGSVTTIDNCSFDSNTGDFTIFSSKISNYGRDNNLTVINSNFTYNTANSLIESAGNLLIVNNSTFKSNNVNGYGAVYAHKSLSQVSQEFVVAPEVYIYNSLFEQNEASFGVIYSNVGVDLVSSSTFISNTGSKGSAISTISKLNVYNSTFESNNVTSDKNGAAIYIEGNSELNVNYSNFRNNKALDTVNSITINSVSGKFNINNNSFRDNAGFDVYSKADVIINADYNWWGSNDNPDLNFDINNWVILTADSSPNYNNATLNVDFNNIKTKDGEILTSNYTIPDRFVRLTSDDGEFVGGYYGGYIFNALSDEILFVPDEKDFNISIYVDDKLITSLNASLKEKITPEIIVDVNNTYVGSPVKVIVRVVNATGNVSVTVGTYSNTIGLINSIASSTISDLAAGNYQLKITYNGNDEYAVTSKNANFNVLKFNTDMSLSFDGENVIVNLSKDATGMVNINAANRNYSSQLINGQAKIDVTSLNIGNYTLSVHYLGDNKYNPVTKPVNVNIDLNIIIEAQDLVKYYGDSARFTAKLSDNEGHVLSNKSLIVSINGLEYTRSTDSNGIMSMAINLASNNYTAIVIYKENGNSKNATAKIQILPTISGDNITKMFRNQTQYYASFMDSNGKPLSSGTEVTFNINGVMYKRLIENNSGRAKLSINLSPGDYIITAINPSNNDKISNKITVLPNIIDNNDISMYFRNGTGQVVRIVGSDGKVVGAGEKVTFNINGVLYTRETNSTGHVRLSINLAQGDYIITSTYNGCSVSNKIKVLPLLSASDLTKKYGVQNPFKVKVVDGQGRALSGVSVKFNINGVFYDRTSDSNGTASININLQVGRYIITSSYNGCNIANVVTVLN